MESYKLYKLYKLVNDLNDFIYIGSTTVPLQTRLIQHRSISNHCSSKVLFENGAIVSIEEIIPTMEITSKEILKLQEEIYINYYRNICVNKNRAIGLTPDMLKEYKRNYSKEKYKNYKNNPIFKEYNRNCSKEYYKNNKFTKSIYVDCECGGVYNDYTKNYHFNSSIQHKDYLISLE